MKSKKSPKACLLHKFSHAWVLIYIPFYMFWFLHLEGSTGSKDMIYIHTFLDDLVPFCEYFIIPYYLWFLYIFATGVILFFKSKCEFYRYCVFLFTGMTLSLCIYQFWPNGLNLRPNLDLIGRDNFFIHTVRNLYAVDTPTNVCPSIHVLNSLGATTAILKSEGLGSKKPIRVASVTLCILICASTVFLKQHSCFDVLCSIIISSGLYVFAYNPKLLKIEAAVSEREQLYGNV